MRSRSRDRVGDVCSVLVRTYPTTRSTLLCSLVRARTITYEVNGELIVRLSKESDPAAGRRA